MATNVVGEMLVGQMWCMRRVSCNLVVFELRLPDAHM